ncbi:hypothetical protein B7P43_G01316 [Cryptotermes secundus]|uniref:Uncharacterized protein n=3 Tax=Cryptotermes secundus TaxID=105785 RepID=A0A2J7REB7_9NEOP|nr:hypothetical protein B7P43_G01316 [Cryptotermes secundus]
MQQMGRINKSPHIESQPDESGDYQTAKLSSTPTGNETRKDNTKLEKTASIPGLAIVKPSKARRAQYKGLASPPNGLEIQESQSHEGSTKDTLSKFQKFGVRVLPDSNASHSSSHTSHKEAKQSSSGEYPPGQGTKTQEIEPEHRQNEHNSIIEKVVEGATTQVPVNNEHSGQRSPVPISTSVTDGAGGKSKPDFCYDERGIDVGPIGPQKSYPKQSFTGHQPEEGKQSGDTHGESNVKNLLTKGFQNLKDKMHHVEKKKNGGQISGSIEQEVHDLTGQPASPHLPKVAEIGLSRKNGTSQQQEGKQDEQEGEIPTEIPEEVCRAAMAALSNRKSVSNAVMETQVGERKRTVLQDGLSGDSSSESDDATTPGNMDSDSLGRTPKKSNKRKAPPPPPEENEEKLISGGQSPYLGSDKVTEEENPSSFPENQKLKDGTSQHYSKTHTDAENVQMTESIMALPLTGKSTSFADMVRPLNNIDVKQREITNITVDGNSNTPLRGDIIAYGASVSENQSTGGLPGRDENVIQDPVPLQQHLDYDEGVNVSSINSDSDSDMEQLEGNSESYEGTVKDKKAKKGGTTIELNSSHITIHHSPSSDTVQLENENTRKAASLGDLSRLDSEQPMSILERAVSLDLADGGTPHGSKKRKAPLPPPGEDYLGGVPDGDDGIAHRKEPRLDTAMDTFQRRRLKKSSDWGTLEEALMQTGNKAVDLQTSKSTEPTEREELHLQSAVTVLRSTPVEQFPKSIEKKEVDAGTAVATFTNSHPGITRTDILGADEVGYSSVLEYGSSGTESMEQMESETPQHQQKTVLRITPEPVSEPDFNLTASQVNIASGTFSMTPTYNDTSNVSGEVETMPRLQADAAHAFNTKVAGLSSPRQSGSSSIVGLVSSTPISHGGDTYNMTTAYNGAESVQSPIITSSHAGISSVHVVSSTTPDISNSNSIFASSITDPFTTAVDSTTAVLAGEISKDDDSEDPTWGQDAQPPELPTSPVPVLSQLSSYKPSPSMTYITEIQVVTTADSSTKDLTAESSPEEQHTTPEEISSSTVTQRIHKYRSDSSLSTDSFTSEGDDKEPDTAHSVTTQGSTPQKGKVTVTSIRNTVSRIPMRITTDRMQPVNIASNNSNHVSSLEDRRVKPARPPVPPRKSDSTTTCAVSAEGGGSGRMLSHIQQLPVDSIHMGPTAGSSSGKFISFSSLTPQVTASIESNATRNSTSFEQWVFLDEGSTHNGLKERKNADDCSSASHSTVVSLPARTQSVTHIVLDSKQSNGSHGKP